MPRPRAAADAPRSDPTITHTAVAAGAIPRAARCPTCPGSQAPSPCFCSTLGHWHGPRSCLHVRTLLPAISMLLALLASRLASRISHFSRQEKDRGAGCAPVSAWNSCQYVGPWTMDQAAAGSRLIKDGRQMHADAFRQACRQRASGSATWRDLARPTHALSPAHAAQRPVSAHARVTETERCRTKLPTLPTPTVCMPACASMHASTARGPRPTCQPACRLLPAPAWPAWARLPAGRPGCSTQHTIERGYGGRRGRLSYRPVVRRLGRGLAGPGTVLAQLLHQPARQRPAARASRSAGLVGGRSRRRWMREAEPPADSSMPLAPRSPRLCLLSATDLHARVRARQCGN